MWYGDQNFVDCRKHQALIAIILYWSNKPCCTIDNKGFRLKFWHYKNIKWRHSDVRVKFVFQCEHRWMRWIRSETFLNNKNQYDFVRRLPVRPGPQRRRDNFCWLPYSKMYSEGKRKLPFASELLNHSICKLLDWWSPPSVCSKFISNWNMAVAYWSSIFWNLKFRTKISVQKR